MRYRDAEAALAWLQRAFGCTEHAVHRGDDGTIAHAELAFGPSIVMFNQIRDPDPLGRVNPDPHASTLSLYIAVEDPDAHHDRAVAAGAEIVRPLTDEDYGSREYSARDPEGNIWSFGTYNPTVPG